MGWAVRGCSGFGGMDGCIFAGLLWGAAWWFIARESGGAQWRPYTSGWIILAVTVGVGISGNRGWMQWPAFFEGHLQTNYLQGRFAPIPRAYGFIWLFVAGVPWAGLGACLLAWCGSHRRTGLAAWALRLACGLGVAWLARTVYNHLPEVFLPLYGSMKAQYADVQANPNLGKLIRDNREALTHLGLYLGFLAFELGRRDWRNATLILTVGLVNGLGWAACQNWKWATGQWPGANFNWWRCWESSGGISIGLAYGLAYFLVNRRSAAAGGEEGPPWMARCPNWERLGAYAGLLLGLGYSVRNGLRGWVNLYYGHEEYWGRALWTIIGPAMVLCLVALLARMRMRPLPAGFKGDVFPHAYGLVWLVLLAQNVIAQLVTGPHSSWNETAFSIYYVLLFLISAVIVHHFRCLQVAGAGAAER